MGKITMVLIGDPNLDSRVQKEKKALEQYGWVVDIISTKHAGHFRTQENLADELSKVTKTDFFHAHDLNTLEQTCLRAKEIGALVVYDSHEVFPYTTNQHSSDKLFIKSTAFLRTLYWEYIEAKYVKEIAGFITVNDSIMEFMKNKYDKLSLIPRKVVKNTNIKYNIPKKAIDKEKTVLFHGSFRKGMSIEKILDCAKYLDDDIKLVFVGDGALYSEIRKFTMLYDNVLLLDYIEPGQILNAVNNATIGLVLPDPINLSKKLSLNAKLFDFLSCEIPVIASDLPEIRKFFKETNLTVALVDPKITEKELANEINLFVNDVYNFHKKNEINKDHKYKWEIDGGRLVALYDQLKIENKWVFETKENDFKISKGAIK